MFGLLLALSLGANNPWLDSARTAYSKLDCDKVLADLKQAADVPTNDAATRLAIFDFKGRCHVALGQPGEADAAFAQMLAIEPQVELDAALSPKIREAFRAAKLKVFPEGYAGFKELPAAPQLKRAELIDPWRRVAVVVSGRWDDAQGRFVEERVPGSGNLYVLQLRERAWYLEARTEKGEVLARLGSRDAPVALAPPRVAEVAPAVEKVEAETAPARPSEGKKVRNTIGVLGLTVGLAAAVTGVVMFGISNDHHQRAQTAEWADEADQLAGQSKTFSAVGHLTLWPGLGVAVIGFGLSF